MKRCPTCNRTFTDEHLSFCTDDGTPLVAEEAPSSFDPQATLMSPQSPETGSVKPPQPTQVYRPDEQPGSWSSPAPHSWSDPTPVKPYAPASPSSWNAEPPAQVWTPPPPPNAFSPTPTSQMNPMAIVSLALGVFSMTIGLFCCMAFVTGPAAIVTGALTLNQMKTNPAQANGKGLAIAGIATGAGSILLLVFWMIARAALFAR